ncbi:MAG: AAA family ATPase, partial [Myxococcota bacterium]
MPLATNVQLRPKGAELFELAKVTPASTRTWLFIYGPKKVGKTTTAFTASKVFGGLGCPIEDRIKAVESGDFEPIHIDDMAFLQTDMGGSTSAIDLGVTLEHVYSLEAITENGYDACDGMVALINAVKDELAGRVRWLVIDTVSILDQMMFPRAIELGGADRFAKFDIQLQQHRQVIAALRSWPGDVIICSHARGLPEIVPGNTATALASAMSQERQRKAIYQTIPDVVPE